MSFFGNHPGVINQMGRLTCILVLTMIVGTTSDTLAQDGGGGFLFGFQRVVGGVQIDQNGVLDAGRQTLGDDIRQQLADSLKGKSADLNRDGLRMVSLRGLEAALTEARQNNTPLSPEIKYMAGLQRIEYIIQSPETQDIILAGPGEGIRVDDEGNVVGATSGMPVIHLEDFLVAMRNVHNARRDYGITVSIDPSQEGVKRLQKMLAQLRTFNPQLASQAEQVMGPQNITLTGIPKDSRYAQILVSADYKMKRLSMGLDPTPDYLPSLLETAQQRDVRFRKMAPRFWMECNYEPVAVSDDGHVWQLRGQGVKTLTDEQFFDKEGNRQAKGADNKLARHWAERMTEQFEQLSRDEPVFRELRNLMDLSVVAAIIARNEMAEQVKLDLPAIQGQQLVSTPSWNVPQKVPTQCSFVKLSRSWMVTASGGVEVDSWGVATRTETVAELGQVAQRAAPQPNAQRWWWNAN